jgi:lipoprotein-anchoring transpeptidase ErfK/SrfK
MRRAPLAVLTLAVLALAAPAQAQEPRIKPGVSAAGVDLSGLTVAEATQRIQTTLGPAIAKPLTLGVAGRPWQLTMEDAGLVLDAERTAKRGLYAAAGTAVPVKIDVRRSATKAWVEGIAKRVARAPRNATVKVTPRRIRISGSRQGHRLDVAAARKLVDAALVDPAAPRVLHKKLTKVRAAVTYQDLLRDYSTAITVDRRTFKARLFKDLRVVRTYTVATGLPAYPTPSGSFRIQSKQVNPTWNVPNSPWAGELAGTTVQGGSAANPLKARWIGFAGSVGFHGTGQEYTVGSRASHGCLRMRVADVIALYKRVSVGDPVRVF